MIPVPFKADQPSFFIYLFYYFIFMSKLNPNVCFSSLKPEEKRGGGGSHNWGTVKDELRSVQQQDSNTHTRTPTRGGNGTNLDE